MNEQRYRVKRDIARRIKVLHLLFTGVVVYFLIHIVLFILLNKEVKDGFHEVRNKTILTTERVRAHRGDILSRDGRQLAVSITRRALRMDFGNPRFAAMTLAEFQREAKALSKNLAEYFGDRSAKEYYDEIMRYHRATIKYVTVYDTIESKNWLLGRKKIEVKPRSKAVFVHKGNRRNRSVQLFRDVDLAEWNDIKEFPLFKRGLGVTYSTEERDHRVYPQGDIALRTIGRLEHHRSYGVEYAMRDTLAGHDGKQLMQTIAVGYKTRVKDRGNIEAQNGYDVVTTLDIDVQDVADNALQKQLLEQNAIWGTTIVMECATGDILAMANLKRNGSTCVEEQNYAIGIPVNPGSTFKLVSTMALLENGVPTSKEYDSELGRRVRVGGIKGATVQDSHAIAKETDGVIDMRRAFAESANVYFTKAVYDTFHKNPVKFSDFCRNLHLHEKVGLQEWGAQSKTIRHLDKTHHSRYNALVNMAYGYGLEVTPLHTITIYNAVANGGRMVAPRLVLRTERDGEVVNEAPIEVIEEQICSQRTIDTLRSFMEEVSLTGTAAEYFGEKRCSFRTGAKTGTAQVDTEINGVRYKRGDGYYYGSMVTYLPAENPRYTIMTAIFTKKQPGKSYYGATLAGPTQKEVASFLYNRDRQYAEAISECDGYASQIKGGNIEKMRRVADEYSDRYSSTSRKGWGKSQVGDDGTLSISTLDMESGRVPNVIGMGLDDALYLLERSGFRVVVVGCGKVVKQSIAPHTTVAKSSKQITITLK